MRWWPQALFCPKYERDGWPCRPHHHHQTLFVITAVISHTRKRTNGGDGDFKLVCKEETIEFCILRNRLPEMAETVVPLSNRKKTTDELPAIWSFRSCFASPFVATETNKKGNASTIIDDNDELLVSFHQTWNTKKEKAKKKLINGQQTFAAAQQMTPLYIFIWTFLFFF